MLRGEDLGAQEDFQHEPVPPEVPFPQYSVGLLQAETEMLQAPEFDLSSFLEADPRWDVELYTEQSVTALVESADRFDCIVVGYNAAYASRDVRETLERHLPNVGLCVLHQFRPEAMKFLTGDLGIELVPLRREGAGVGSAAELEPLDEILLNWPDPVPLDRTTAEGHDGAGGAAQILSYARAYLGLAPAPGTRWRTVLEVADARCRHPAVVRTETRRWPPLVVSTALLAPRHAAHAALLSNMILWCASGRPSAVVVEAPAVPDAPVLHRKMRLQGSKAIAHPLADESELDFDQWPFRGITNVLLPASWDPTQKDDWPGHDPRKLRPWLSRGGRIAVLGPGDGLTVRHGESDAHWAAARWATWFSCTSPESWHGGHGGQCEGNIAATRAVLRLLAALHGDEIETVPGIMSVRKVRDELATRGHRLDPEALGLPPPAIYADPVRRMLRRRIGDSNNVDGTVSVTVAALDIDALLVGEALPGKRLALEQWLEGSFDAAALEDKLEIARVLRDSDMLERGVEVAREGGRLEHPVSAVLLTALRNATVACEPDPTSVNLSSLETRERIMRRRNVVRRELRMSRLLAANYLIGLRDLQAHWGDDSNHPLATPTSETVDRAVITVGRSASALRGGPREGWAEPEMASDEALALIAYFGRHPTPTNLIGDVDAVPPQMLTSVLQESEALRRENERRTRDEATVGHAATIIAIVGLLVVSALGWLTWLVTHEGIPLVPEVGLLAAVVCILVLALMAGLNQIRLLPSWASGFPELLGEGMSGLRERLARAAGRRGPPGD